MPITIEPLSNSIYNDADDEYKVIFDSISEQILEEPNWFLKSKTFLTALDALKKLRKDLNPEELAAELSIFIGGILEKLNEQEIITVQQVVFYELSGHIEHQNAAENWAKISPKHLKTLRKILSSSQMFRNIIKFRVVYGEQNLNEVS